MLVKYDEDGYVKSIKSYANTVSYDICGGYNNQGTAIERMAECPI